MRRTQRDRVLELLANGGWHTTRELVDAPVATTRDRAEAEPANRLRATSEPEATANANAGAQASRARTACKQSRARDPLKPALQSLHGDAPIDLDTALDHEGPGA